MGILEKLAETVKSLALFIALKDIENSVSAALRGQTASTSSDAMIEINSLLNQINQEIFTLTRPPGAPPAYSTSEEYRRSTNNAASNPPPAYIVAASDNSSWASTEISDGYRRAMENRNSDLLPAYTGPSAEYTRAMEDMESRISGPQSAYTGPSAEHQGPIANIRGSGHSDLVTSAGDAREAELAHLEILGLPPAYSEVLEKLCAEAEITSELAKSGLKTMEKGEKGQGEEKVKAGATPNIENDKKGKDHGPAK